MTDRTFTYEIQHIFPREIVSGESLEAQAARDLLSQIGFDLEALGNKVPLLTNSDAIGAYTDAPPEIWAALEAAGFGRNRHDSQASGGNHPGYNNFLIDTLAEIKATADIAGWSTEARSLAVHDLHRFITEINRTGSIAIIGSSDADFRTAWNAQGGIRDYPNLILDDATRFFEVEQYRDSLNRDAVDVGSEFNSQARYLVTTALSSAASSILTAEEIADAQRGLDRATPEGGESGQASSAAYSILYNLNRRSNNPVRGQRVAAEVLANEAILDGESSQTFEDLADQIEAILQRIGEYANEFAGDLIDFGESVFEAASKAIEALLAGDPSQAVSSIPEFLNEAYEPLKKGIQTGDWEDFLDIAIEQGVQAALGVVVVTGSIVATAAIVGLVAPPLVPIVASFVAAGWAAYGIYEAVDAGIELFDKITTDLVEGIEKIGDSINDIFSNIDQTVGVVLRIVSNALDVDFSSPLFNQIGFGPDLVTEYVVDSVASDLPNSVEGSDEEERFFARNSGVVDAGGGDDELYVRHSVTARGGAGNDILAGANARVVRAGDPIDPDNPDSPLATDGLRMLLDGGAGNDVVINIGGEGAIVIGGEGNDLVYNSSYRGQLWGDGLNDLGPTFSGETNSDTFWWSSGSFIMDAGKNDRLQLFGVPLIGGTNNGLYGVALEKGVARDFFLPWVTYGLTSSDQLLVEASPFTFSLDNPLGNLDPDMTEDEILEIAQVVQNWEPGDLGIEFSIFNPDAPKDSNLLLELFRFIGEFADAASRFAKNLTWRPADDPLVLDLNGDGYVSKGIGALYWDNDGDLFGERSGWLSGEDGFLVHDADGDGEITATELFGGPGLSGFDELSDWDSNGDNIIDANDVGFGNLQIWRDANEDGVTDAGELYSLADFDVTAFSLNAQPVDLITANGTTIRAESFFARSDGTTGGLGELIFETDPSDTQYLGDDRVASFAPEGTAGLPINAFGYGITTDLAVAASNDLELAQLIESTAAGMTVPDLDVLRGQARGVLGAWARSHSDSLELGAAMVGADGSLMDFAVYNEDETGGFWTLNSGADVLASDGSVIARASFEDVLAQTTTGGASWQAIQGWSPSSREFTPENRLETAYLISTNGAATVLDYAIRQSDGQGEFWTLASGNDVFASDGSVIARASLDDIMAQSAVEGSAWRMEDFADPIPDAGFDRAAFNIRDGVVVDYSIWIDDGNGLFAVWASVFEQALDSQERFGPNSFGLRGFELDLDNLPDADNSDDSVVRVEIMSLDEIQYAFASGGEAFRPELFVAQSASDNTLSYDFDIDDTKEFAGTLAESYLAIGRAMAVRIASQGGLAPYFEGVQYDPNTDTFQATSNRELIPLFTAILADAPAGADETVDYLREWDRVLQTVYPDFKRNGRGPRSQAFLMQMIVAGFENSPVDASFLQVAEALSINEERVLIAEAGSEDVVGTRGDDLIYIADGAASARGGLGSDVYIIGRDFGEVLIQDVEPILQPGASDYLRFAHLTPDDVFVTKDGADLIIQEIGTDNVITIKNQFEGRWPGLFGGDFSDNTEIVEINFADGTAWDFVDMAYAASHPLDSADVVFGTDAIDVLDGGAGNDILRGGGDGDLYIFDYGYGEDRIVDAENNPFRNALDLVVFGDGIDADLLSFERIGSSNDLIIHLLDEDGVRTGDILTIEGQFFQQDAFITTLKPNRIEILAFEDGTFLDEKGIRDRVVAEARTDGEDAIWAFDEAETLDGGAGNDLLVGQDGADTYVFARGYGDDVLQDRSFEVGLGVVETVNTLQLQGINAADIEILREPGSPTVSLRIKDTGETVTLKNQFEVTFVFFTIWRDNVDLIQFGDGTVWDQDRLGREVLALERTDGDDTIIGFDWSDTLDGGAGDDRLEGGLFNDTYIFREGYGNDTVFDTGAGKALLLPAGFDRLDLQGIDLIDVEFSRQANDLTLTLRSTGESVTLEGQYDRLGDTVIEELRFNGLAVDWRDLGADDIDLVGTSGDDTLIGTHYAERIDGRGGNDILIGSSDGDTYIFDIGYGQDVINDRIDAGAYRAADTIEFGTNVQFADVRFTKEGNDLFISIEGFTDTLRVLDQFGSVLSGVENFVFADGNALTIEDVEEQLQIAGGTRGDNILNAIDDRPNILDGRQGDDQLNGGSFSDTYLFGVEYGFDTITEKRDSDSVDGAVDRVVFGRLVNPEDVIFRADGTNLVVTIPSSGEQLTIVDGLGNRQIEEFDFFDGTVWGQAEIRAALLRGTDGDDLLIGFDNSDDVIAGGLGSDLLIGKAGDDTYRFNIGDGLDAIEDSAGVDRVELGEGISADMLRFSQVDEGLLIRFDGIEDSLLIRDGFNPSSAVETIVLADGFEFEFEDIRSFVLANKQTVNDDIIEGFAGRADRLEGGAGNDELLGLSGDDFYIIGEDPGLDIISDSSGTDRIRFTAGTADQLIVRRPNPGSGDLAISFADRPGETVIRGALTRFADTIEEFEFADGEVLSLDDLLTRFVAAPSTDGDDLIRGLDNDRDNGATFDGGLGDDIIVGNDAPDVFVFRRGDGRDVISPGGGGLDVLRIEGYAPEDLSFSPFDSNGSSFTWVIEFAGTDDQIVIRGQGSTSSRIDQIEFTDGQIITAQEISDSLPFRPEPSDGDDILDRRTELDGGLGDDILIGSPDANTYRFRRGNGNDIIREQEYDVSRGHSEPVPVDTLFLEGINPDEISVARSVSDPLSIVITILDTGETLTIDGTPFDPLEGEAPDRFNLGRVQRDDSGGNWIERIIFADGTEISQRDLEQRIYDEERTAGDDVIDAFGSSTDDFFNTPEGAYLDGGAGNDIYRSRFDIVHIRMSAGQGSDTLELDQDFARIRIRLEGLDIDDVREFTEYREGEVYTVLRATTGEELTVKGRRSFIFLDENGAEIDRNNTDGIFDGTPGVDYLIGEASFSPDFGFFTSRDTFRPGQGNDVVFGNGTFTDFGGADGSLQSSGFDTVILAVGDGLNWLYEGSQYEVELGDGFDPSEAVVTWLNDGTDNVQIDFNATGDGIIVGSQDLGAIYYSDGTALFGSVTAPDPVLVLEEGDIAIDNSPFSQQFVALEGEIFLSFGDNTGNDFFIDQYIQDAIAAGEAPAGTWFSNTLDLRGGASLDDFEFVQDTSSPNDLIVRNLLTGSAVRLVGQLADLAFEAPSPWNDVFVTDLGAPDWFAPGIVPESVLPILEALETDGDGEPNWLDADLDGDGNPDWQTPAPTFAALDSNGDGEFDIFAYDVDENGLFDEFEIEFPNGDYLYLYDTDGDDIPDEYDSDADGSFGSLPVDILTSEIAWLALDTNQDGTPDLAVLDTDGDGTPNFQDPDIDGDGLIDWSVEFGFDVGGGDDFIEIPFEGRIQRRIDPLTGRYRYQIIPEPDDGITILGGDPSGPGGGILIGGEDPGRLRPPPVDVIVIRDSDGDGTPDQWAFDNDRNFQPDVDENRELIAFNRFNIWNDIGPIDDGGGFNSFDWAELLAEVGPLIRRDESDFVAPEDRLIELDLDARRPDATAGDDALVARAGETINGIGGDDGILLTQDNVTVEFGPGSGNDFAYADYQFFSDQNNRLELTGITSLDEVTLTASEDQSDLIVTVNATGESIKLVDQRSGPRLFSEIRLADGTIFTADEIEARTIAPEQFEDYIEGGDGNDQIFTGEDNDSFRSGTLRGGLGDDLLTGGRDDDTYLYSAGDGYDIIDDRDGEDVIRISGYSSSDLRVRDWDGFRSHIQLDFGGGDGILINRAYLTSATSNGIERVIFEDTGEVLTQADLISRALLDLATIGDDFIEGTSLDNTLTGDAGADILAGGAGNDTYLFDAGDGTDRIVDTSGTADRVIFRDFSAADITNLFRSPPAGDDLIITFATGDTAILAGALSDGDEGVDFIEFTDGTTIMPEDLRAELIASFDTPSASQVYGFAGNDTLAGGEGDDALFGLGGDDTYLYSAGDGNDRIEDNGGGTDRIIIEGYSSTDVRLSRLFYASTGVAINFIGSPQDSITVINLTSEGEDRIEFIEFADDGVVWDFATIEALVGNNAPVVNPDGFRDVVQGTVLAIDSESLLSNDFDADGDPLAIQGVGEVIGGSAALLPDGTIEFTADSEFTGFASVAYLVTDGRQGVTEASVSIRVRPVAIANDDVGLTVNEDETLIIRDRDLLANDVDGDRFEVAQVKDAVNGTVSLSTSGDITFTPFAEFHGEATFVYVANTPDGGRDEALVTIDVLPVNDAPIARNDATGLTTDEGVPITLDRARVLALLDNDSDVDGDTLTISGVSGDGNVDVFLNDDGSVLITPIGDFFGSASFTYLLDDGAGGTDSATASLFVNPVNDVPVTQADSFVIDEDNPLFISGDLLTDNDFDPDGTQVVISAVRNAIGGNVELFENNTILFTPDRNFFGLAGFTYVVDDNEGGVTSQTVTITVDPINDAPVARDERPFGIGGLSALVTNQDQVLVIDPATLLANDFDIEGDPVSIETVTGGVNGDVELRDDGLIYFTPDENYWGFGTFRYVISDPEGLVDDGNVSVYFRPTGNVAPVAVDDVFTGVEDQPLIITREQLLANDFDPNGDAIELVRVRSLGASANELADFYFNDNGDLVIEPIADLPGSGTLLYTISDGVFTDEGRIDVSFTPVDDAPTAGDDDDIESGLGRPVVIRISDLKANDFDIDQSAWLSSGGFVHRFGADNLEILDTLTSTQGTASIYGDEFIVIEIDPAFSGDLTLGYTLSDETGLTDTANASTTVRDNRDLIIEGTELRDLLIGSAEGETLIGLGGVDDLFGREGDDILRGGDGADILDGGEGFDIADFSDSDVALRVDINSRIGQGGFAQGDELISIEGLIGGLGSDQLFGTDEFNTIAGSAGDDFIDGRDGDDVLSGDEGDDTIVGAEGADSINGGEGGDTADYSDSLDPVVIDLAAGTASGGDAEGDTLISIENLIGTLGADSLTGDDQANLLIGGRGADTIFAGGGDDLIEGGRDGDIIDGGEGVDTARYWLSETGITIDLSAGTASGGDAEGDQITSVENIIGSAHDDTITGDAEDNVIAGLGGSDALDGGDGIDTLDYNDSVGGIAIDLGAGTGSVGDAAGDTVSNFENVRGSRFGDDITGDAGDNLLDGSLGDDTLAGAGGSDRYILARSSGSDIINEATALSDTDVLEIVGDFAPDAVNIYADGDDLIVELEQGEGIGSDKVRITDHFIGDGTGIETLIFGDGTVWDRETIDSNAGASRLQAEGDIVRLVDEDVAFTFAASDLLVNDVSADDAVLSVVSVEAITGGSITLNDDDTITFLGEQDFNGDAFFRYRMTDGTGRVSSAVVEVNVRPVNDAPVAVDDDDGYVVNEDGSVSIPFAWLLGNDSDIDGDSLTISGFAEVDGGNGTATIEAAGFVTFRPDRDYNGSAAFRYRLSDRNGGFDFATVSIEVLPVNDAPRPQSDNATVRSGDDILISAASLLANDFDLEGDAFSFAGIDQGANGTAALEIITGAQFIRFTPDADFEGSASFTYSVVEDGTGLMGTASVNVTVLPANDPPVARGETFDGLEDTPLVITQAELLANDTDPNGDTLVVSRLDEFPEQGSVAFDDDGNIVFTPAPDYNGPASFKYWVSDGEFEDEATASIEVAPINDAPVVVDDEGPFIGDEDKVFVIRAADVFGNDSDPEGDVLEFAEFETDIGTIELDGGNLLLTPPLNFNGTITVRYRARDDKGAISEDFASVTIEISDIADAPETVADSFTIAEDTSLELAAIDLIGNDTDVDSTDLTLVAVENAVGGAVSLENGVVTFTPNPDSFGTASFEYLVTDGDTNPVTGTVTIEVTPVNDAARVVGDSFASDEDVALNLAPSAFLANDFDPDGDTITITSVTAITEGANAVIEDDGTITLTPPANESGQIRFEYTVSDGTVVSTAQVSVFVAAVNDAPVLDAELADLSSAEDAVFSFAIETDNFSDVDSSPLAYSATLGDGSPLPDWMIFDGVNLKGTPPQHFNGALNVTVTANDGEFSASGTFVLTIDPVNDAPILVQMLSDVSSDEDTVISFALPADAFVDVDGETLSLTAALSDRSALPDWLTFDGETFEGTPPQDFNGNLELTVSASDGEFTAEDTFTLSIDPVNDAPVLVQALSDVTSQEDAAIRIAVPTDTFTDVDGEALALTAALSDGSDLPAWLSFDGAAFTGTPPQNFNGSLDLTVAASDGELSVSDTFTLTIDPVNDAPILVQAIEDANTAEDKAFAFGIPAETFADVDRDALTLTATLSDGSELPGWISFDGVEFTGTPPENFFGFIGLTVTASDGELSVSDNFTLQIASVNDAPVLLQGIANAFSPEDAAISIALPANTFVDIDGDSLTLTARLSDGSPLPDWLSFDGTAFTGTPPQDFNGAFDLTVTASDGALSAYDTFTLTIDPVNDAPTLVQALPDVSFAEDNAINVAVPPETFADIDGPALTLSATLSDGSDLPPWLAFDGATITGTPPQDFNGALGLLVTASDGQLTTDAAFTLTIDPVNDAPGLVQALADVSSDEDASLSIALPAEAFADVDGDALTLSATLADGTALPAWLNFNGAIFTGTPPQDFNGAFGLTVTATDGELNVSDTFTLTIAPVNDVPVLTQALADQSIDGNAGVQFAIPQGSFVDVDGDALSYSAKLADGSTLPSWLTFDEAQQAFTGTAPNEDAALGVRVIASDGSLSASDEFTINVSAVDTGGGNSDGFTFVSLNSWYNPAWGGGYNVTFEYEVQPEAIADGELRAWDILASYTGPGTITNGWVNGFPGPASFEVTPDGARFSTDGQSYQPDLAEGQTFRISLQINDAPYTQGDFGFEIFDRDPALNLADQGNAALTVSPTNDWGSGLTQNVSFSNTSGENIRDWQMVLNIPEGVDFNVTNVWGATATKLTSGDYLFEAVSSNEEITPGGQASFGFNASYSGASGFQFTTDDFAFTDADVRQFDVARENLGTSGPWTYGTDGDDVVIGAPSSASRIFGAVGNDNLTGGALADILAGGSGDDILTGLDGDDTLVGGRGNDLLYGGLGFDKAQLLGYRDSYAIVTQSGDLGVRVTDLSAIAHGDDGIDQLSSIEQLMFRDGETLNIASPIILDLSGDGIETLSASESDALFDLDGDGLADDTSWIGAGDAFLYLDRDGNGTMSGIEEISFIDDIPNAGTDLDGLVAFDSNGDGVLDASDDRFDEFGVWQDADGDGAVDEGETANLTRVGIASINLTGTPVNGDTEFGEVVIANTGNFTLTNGATLEFADAALTYFSAATNVQGLSTTDYSFDRKAKNFRIHYSSGLVSVDRKRRGQNISQASGQLGADTILNFDGRTFGRFAPVVLDLDGNGVDLVRRSKSDSTFDYQGNGARVDTGWISGGDAFLVIDRDNDGLITQGSELSLAAEDEQARTGLQGLFSIDSNGDGVVDADDARFGELRVWQDANENGRTDAGELRTLAQEGIVSISLAAVGLQGRVKVTKSAITAITTFTRSNGATGTAADVSLAYRPADATVVQPAATSGSVGLGLVNDVQAAAFWSTRPHSFTPDLNEVFEQLRRGTNTGLATLFDRLDPVDSALSGVTLAQQAMGRPGEDPSSMFFAQNWSNDMWWEQRLASGAQRLALAGLETRQASDVDTARQGAGNEDEPAHLLPADDMRRTAESGTSREQVALVEVAPAADRVVPSDLARKLMIMRQEMNTFGANSGAETDRLRDNTPEYLNFYA